MQEGTAQVRSVLGPEVSISDKDIQDSLWHYYYDIERTVTYLLSMYLTVILNPIWRLMLVDQRSIPEARKAKKTGEEGRKKAKGRSDFSLAAQRFKHVAIPPCHLTFRSWTDLWCVCLLVFYSAKLTICYQIQP